MLIPLCATASLVFLRALQQQNVIHGHYTAAAVTSYLMAAADVGVVLSVVQYGWDAVHWIGTGGAIGVTAAMPNEKICGNVLQYCVSWLTLYPAWQQRPISAANDQAHPSRRSAADERSE